MRQEKNERGRERDKDNQRTSQREREKDVIMMREGGKKKRLSSHFPVTALDSDWLNDLWANPLLALLATG